MGCGFLMMSRPSAAQASGLCTATCSQGTRRCTGASGPSLSSGPGRGEHLDHCAGATDSACPLPEHREQCRVRRIPATTPSLLSVHGSQLFDRFPTFRGLSGPGQHTTVQGKGVGGGPLCPRFIPGSVSGALMVRQYRVRLVR